MKNNNKAMFQIITFYQSGCTDSFTTETHEYIAETPGSIVKKYIEDYPKREKDAYKMLVLNTVTGTEYKFERFAGGWNIIG